MWQAVALLAHPDFALPVFVAGVSAQLVALEGQSFSVDLAVLARSDARLVVELPAFGAVCAAQECAFGLRLTNPKTDLGLGGTFSCPELSLGLAAKNSFGCYTAPVGSPASNDVRAPMTLRLASYHTVIYVEVPT